MDLFGDCEQPDKPGAKYNIVPEVSDGRHPASHGFRGRWGALPEHTANCCWDEHKLSCCGSSAVSAKIISVQLHEGLPCVVLWMTSRFDMARHTVCPSSLLWHSKVHARALTDIAPLMPRLRNSANNYQESLLTQTH